MRLSATSFLHIFGVQCLLAADGAAFHIITHTCVQFFGMDVVIFWVPFTLLCFHMLFSSVMTALHFICICRMLCMCSSFGVDVTILGAAHVRFHVKVLVVVGMS